MEAANQAGLRAFGVLVESWGKGGAEGLVLVLLVTARKQVREAGGRFRLA